MALKQAQGAGRRAEGRAAAGSLSKNALRCRRKFLRFFPDGFRDETYIDWERGYKETAHEQWVERLGRTRFRSLLTNDAYDEIANAAVRIESRTNLLFSFEKMALRDAVKGDGARAFATGLYDWLHGPGSPERRFERWIEVVSGLPRRQTRVLTWPVVTVFGFVAQPTEHFFLKPTVTKIAAQEYGAHLEYRSRPNWQSYRSVLELAGQVLRDQRDLGPRDMIDAQSFLWVQGSGEYEE